MVRERIDILLARSGLAPSREKAQALIMAGEVYVGGDRITRADRKIENDAVIEVRGNPVPFVSFGGVKLKCALDAFSVDVTGKTAIDIGSSTGGFVDCLLQSGAVKIYAFDAGTHQLHDKLRQDSRVLLRENFNARYLLFSDVGEQTDIITIDVSFISLKKILPVVPQFMREESRLISLVKPQFEVGRYEVGKGGIVKNELKIKEVLADITEFGNSLGLKVMNRIEAPRDRARKNREYLVEWAL